MIPINNILDLLINLIKNMAVIIVLAYVFTRTKVYSHILNKKKLDWQQKILLSLVFGLFSIFGTLSGIEIYGAIANIRDLGPAIAGLIGGPLVGIGAGLIGGLHRYTIGGLTALPCSIATVLAGIIGGLIYHKRKGTLPDIKTSVIFIALFETFHMGLNLVMVKPFETIYEIIKNVSVPMIVTNSLGMATFIYIIHNLVKEREIQRQKELIDGELKVAREIQMSIVPKLFPPYPKRQEFDLYAVLHPAKEVGGDLYDFFLIDNDHLCFSIGDVSGKGVPASLFMAVTKTLVKSKVDSYKAPEEILRAVNDELCSENQSGMFVTEFLAVLTISSGEIRYSNGGHNRPYVLRMDGRVEQLPKTTGIALGAMDGMPYEGESLLLNKGDMLVMYTDGVTEAMNEQGELYGETRLEKTLERHSEDTTQQLIDRIMDSIQQHVKDAEQSDDITLLVLKYEGVKL